MARLFGFLFLVLCLCSGLLLLSFSTLVMAHSISEQFYLDIPVALIFSVPLAACRLSLLGLRHLSPEGRRLMNLLLAALVLSSLALSAGYFLDYLEPDYRTLWRFQQLPVQSLALVLGAAIFLELGIGLLLGIPLRLWLGDVRVRRLDRLLRSLSALETAGDLATEQHREKFLRTRIVSERKRLQRELEQEVQRQLRGFAT